MKQQGFLFVFSTAIAATAAAPLPDFSYFQQSEPLPLLQRQYSQLEQETYYGDQGLARVQYSKSKSVGVDSLTLGQVIKVQYIAPSSGRASVNLHAANGDIVLHADSRINYYGHTDTYFLTARANGHWEPSQVVTGFPFTCPPVPTMITVRMEVKADEFDISVNDIPLAKYKFRGSLTPDKVVKVECGIDDNNASKKGKVKDIYISF